MIAEALTEGAFCGRCGEWSGMPGDEAMFRLKEGNATALRCEVCLPLAVLKGLDDLGEWTQDGAVIRERKPDPDPEELLGE